MEIYILVWFIVVCLMILGNTLERRCDMWEYCAGGQGEKTGKPKHKDSTLCHQCLKAGKEAGLNK